MQQQNRPIILDHSIVGQHLTSLTIRKDREFAACRICGAFFQSRLNIEVGDVEYANDPDIQIAAKVETVEWRIRHNKKHPDHVHLAFIASGLTFTPEAAHKLAPFGLVPVADAEQPEIKHALATAPRAPVDDVETTMKGVS
jgi:hypothetical protein